MGMFDALKKGIAKFTGKVVEEAKVAEEPKGAKAPAPPAPAPAKPEPAKPAAKKASAEDDWEAELAAIEAEVEAERKATPASPAPVVKAPEPAKPAPVAPAPPVAKPTPAPAPVAPAAPPKPTPAPPAPAAKAHEQTRPRDASLSSPQAAAEPAKPAPQPAPAVAAKPAVLEQPKPPQPAPQPAPKPEGKPSFEVVQQKPAPAAPAPASTPVAPTPPPTPVAKPAQAPSVPAAAPAGAAESGKPINVEHIDDLLWDLELSLLESDVALPVVEQIKESLKLKLPAIRVRSADEVPQKVEQALREALLETLSVKPIDFDTWVLERTMEKKPVVIMFVGVNGTGKTTSIGRIAHRLKENGYTSVMAAGDTFRAGAIAQLEKHAEKVGVSFIKTNPGGDPAAVAFDAIEHAKGRMKDVVLLDTAGRMQTNTNLMDEMKKIKRVAKPDMIVFVGDSLAGNDAVEQAVHFDKAVGIDAVVLTKVDTDAKGGAALSIAKAVGKPILFLGVGQEYGDLVPYDPQWMVDRIFEAA